MGDGFVIGGIAVAILAALVVSLVFFHYGALWMQAYMSGADVSMMSLIGMSFRHVTPSMIVTAKVMGRQAGLNIDRQLGMSTAQFGGPLPSLVLTQEYVRQTDRVRDCYQRRGSAWICSMTKRVCICLAIVEVGGCVGNRVGQH